MQINVGDVGKVFQIKSIIASHQEKLRLFDFGFVPKRKIKLCYFDKTRGAVFNVDNVAVMVDLNWLKCLVVE